jgi:hypothetical protein
VVYQRGTRTPEWTAANRALDAATTAQDRQTAQSMVDALLDSGELVVREIVTGREVVMQAPGLLKSAPQFSADARGVLFIGANPADLTRSDIYLASDATAPVRLTDQPGHKASIMVDPSGAALLYTVSGAAPFRAPGVAGRGRGAGNGAAPGRAGSNAAAAVGLGANPAAQAPAAAGVPPPANAAPAPNPCGGGGTPSFGVVDLRTKTTHLISGTGPTMSADGGTIAWMARTGDQCALTALMTSPTLTGTPKTVRPGASMRRPSRRTEPKWPTNS